MRVLVRRLRRLELGLLPPAETAESRQGHQVVLDIRRARAARLDIPGPEDAPAPAHRPGMSIGDTTRAGVQHIAAHALALGSGRGRDFSDARCAGILA